MKIALMSDIHGNPKAFETALEDAKNNKVGRIICLGDVVGYGYDPMSCIELAQKKCDLVLKGNHDAGVVGELSLRWFSDTACRGVMRHRNQIDDDAKKWLKSLNYTYRSTKDKFVCSHGTYFNPSEYEYVDSSYVATWDLKYIAKSEGEDYRTQFTGHTHMSVFYGFTTKKLLEQDDVRYNLVDDEFGMGLHSIKSNRSYSINVGSVGYPRNEDDSVYVIYDTDKKKIEYRRIPFDMIEYQSRLGEAGISIPHWLSSRIERMGEK